jgi:hypothetical protein
MNHREFLDHQSDHSARLRTQHVHLGPHCDPVVRRDPVLAHDLSGVVPDGYGGMLWVKAPDLRKAGKALGIA